jgi:hypothetical protein
MKKEEEEGARRRRRRRNLRSFNRGLVNAGAPRMECKMHE